MRDFGTVIDVISEAIWEHVGIYLNFYLQLNL